MATRLSPALERLTAQAFLRDGEGRPRAKATFRINIERVVAELAEIVSKSFTAYVLVRKSGQSATVELLSNKEAADLILQVIQTNDDFSIKAGTSGVLLSHHPYLNEGPEFELAVTAYGEFLESILHLPSPTALKHMQAASQK